MVNFFKKPLGILILAGIVLVLGGFFFGLRKSEPPESIAATRQDIIEEVSATGRVKPAQSVNLSFDRSGRISRVLVSVGERVFSGQVLSQIENSDLAAELLQAEASVKAQAAKLEEIKRGTRSEEIAVEEAKVKEARENLRVKIQDAYTKSEDAVRNKVDQFISNARYPNPSLNIPVYDSKLKSDIEFQRGKVEELLLSWKNSLAGIQKSAELENDAVSAQMNLQEIKSFVEKTALAVNSATPSSGLSQTTLDGYKSDVSTARTNLETALINVTSASTNLYIQEKELLLKKAGALPEKITAQEGALEEAQAKAENIKAQLEKTRIRSSINGVITAVNVEAGEIAPLNTVAISVISADTLQVEVNVPETDFAKIKIGQTADVILDAYGGAVVFEAKVVSIDPAETVVDGIATYKTVFQFLKSDDRVRSGMTADVTVVIAKAANAISIPQRAVFTQNGTKKVEVLKNNGEIEERIVSTGLRGRNGNVEVLEGLGENERVVLSK